MLEETDDQILWTEEVRGYILQVDARDESYRLQGRYVPFYTINTYYRKVEDCNWKKMREEVAHDPDEANELFEKMKDTLIPDLSLVLL